MFQRLRGAIDRTIAEEQARQKSPVGDAPGQSASSTQLRRGEAGQARRTRGNNANTDLTNEAPVNPDPAVFEAAFVIDDSDEPSRSGTPKPSDASSVKSKPAKLEKPSPDSNDASTDKDNNDAEDTDNAPAGRVADAQGSESKPQPITEAKPAASASNSTKELSPEIRQRLRKLEKLENTYPELLRSYRVAHKRATSIEPFEKALRENTPLTSIADPEALTEYLNQLNLRGDMAMEELKKVAADKTELEKTQEGLKAQIAKLQDDLNSQQQQKVTNATPQASSKDTKDQDEQDFFSYDDEIPQLQAELSTKSEQIERLQVEAEELKKKVSVGEENSASLAANLESATKELETLQEKAGSEGNLQQELDSLTEEVVSLRKQLGDTQTKLSTLQTHEKDAESSLSKVKELETSLATSDKRITELEADNSKAANAKTVAKKLVDDLKTQVDELKKEKVQVQKQLDEAEKALESQKASKPTNDANEKAPEPSIVEAATPAGPSKKKNNKKKKGKGGTTNVSGKDGARKPDEPTVNSTHQDGSATSSLETEVSRLKQELEEKDGQIDKLSIRKKTEDDLREEIESLQDDLVHIGQDHVEVKDKAKALEEDKANLQSQIAALEERMKSEATNSEISGKLQGDLNLLQKEHDELREKSATLQSDLEAAQRLAQARFKDLNELKTVLQAAQPELKNLREGAATLKTTKDELATKGKELLEMEKKSKESKRELDRAQQLLSDRDKELKYMKSQLEKEGDAKTKLEEAQRNSSRNIKRVETEKAEAQFKVEKAEREAEKVQEDLKKLRSRVRELEEQMQKLKREKIASQEEVEFKTQQYTNAQQLLSSMREQTSEMSLQLKESKSQAESLEEELVEVQKLLQERTREGETMRRLLADVDDRADGKVREMRARMEAAVEERERIEDESSAQVRRRARESEELKQKIRELERDVKTLSQERDELEEMEKKWRRRREELETVEGKAEAEAEEMRTTVSQLRTALDASEGQVRDGEKHRADLRKMLDDSRQRYQKVSKELTATQAKLVGSSARSSTDSSRNGSAGDMTYLKTILLQFLEQKDSKLRSQLVPVLGKLLKFDKTDERKWTEAVQRIEVR